MAKNANAYLAAQFLKRMKYWNHAKIEKEYWFSLTGPDSGVEAKAWHEALASEVKRRNIKL